MKGDIKALRKELKRVKREYADDKEAMHVKADEALLRFIGDKSVSELHRSMAAWYA